MRLQCDRTAQCEDWWPRCARRRAQDGTLLLESSTVRENGGGSVQRGRRAYVDVRDLAEPSVIEPSLDLSAPAAETPQA